MWMKKTEGIWLNWHSKIKLDQQQSGANNSRRPSPSSNCMSYFTPWELPILSSPSSTLCITFQLSHLLSHFSPQLKVSSSNWESERESNGLSAFSGNGSMALWFMCCSSSDARACWRQNKTLHFQCTFFFLISVCFTDCKLVCALSSLWYLECEEYCLTLYWNLACRLF